jgi:hypothetical protein
MSLRSRIAVLVTLLLALNGCVNLDDAAGLSKLSDQVRNTLPKVSNDVAGTCARQNTLVTDTPANERPPNVQPQDCKPYQEISDRLAKDESVLADYLDALGKLASNKPLSYDAAIDTNVTATSGNSALSADTISAGTDAQKVLKALADAATKGYREKQLGQLIQQTDPAIQSLTKSLKRVITIDYALLLSNEETSLDSFYKGPMAAQSNERLTLILVQRQYANDKTALQSRKDAMGDYGKVMDDLAALHTKLNQQSGQKINVTELAKQAGPIAESLKSALSDIQSRSN